MSSNANLSFIDTCWFSLEIVGFHWVFIKLTMKKPSLVMMRECPCSTKTREGLENPSPPPSRFPLAMGFAPLDPRDFPRASPSGNPSGLGVQNPWPREISQDFPRPSRFPSGFALGKSLGSREILGVGDGFSNPSLLLVEHGYSISPANSANLGLATFCPAPYRPRTYIFPGKYVTFKGLG